METEEFNLEELAADILDEYERETFDAELADIQ